MDVHRLPLSLINFNPVTVPIQALYDYYDQTGPHNATYEISACSVAGDVAMVRIESKFGEAEFSDMFIAAMQRLRSPVS